MSAVENLRKKRVRRKRTARRLQINGGGERFIKFPIFSTADGSGWVQGLGYSTLHRILSFSSFSGLTKAGNFSINTLRSVIYVCGVKHYSAYIPSYVSMDEAPRCLDCCLVLGIPSGNGVPSSGLGEPTKINEETFQTRLKLISQKNRF